MPALTTPQGPGHTWSRRFNAQTMWPWHDQIAMWLEQLVSAGRSRDAPSQPTPGLLPHAGCGPASPRGFSVSKHASHSSMWCHFPLIQIHNVCSSLKNLNICLMSVLPSPPEVDSQVWARL